MGRGSRINYSGEHQKELAGILRQVGHRHGLFQVWRDFVAMCAIAMSNVADKANAEQREAEYMSIVGRYEKDEARLLAQGFPLIAEALEAETHDFLGSLYMSLELGNQWAGQFFTPFPVCVLMSKMQMTDAKRLIDANGFIRVSDPCVGGGAMILAAAEALKDEGINYQRHMHAVAQDIDITAVHMAYVQLSLMHIPAVVIHGNTLAMESRSQWRTLAHTMGGWDWKLARVERAQAQAQADQQEQGEQKAPTAEQPDRMEVFAVSAEVQRIAQAAATRKPRRNTEAPQFTLF